jgi:hypothetical protein
VEVCGDDTNTQTIARNPNEKGLAACLVATDHAACAFRIDGTSAPVSPAVGGLVLLRYANGARDATLVANVGGGVTASTVANHVAQQRAVVDVNGDGVFSKEMGALQLAMRLIGSV